jgi:hypothetical protein
MTSSQSRCGFPGWERSVARAITSATRSWTLLSWNGSSRFLGFPASGSCRNTPRKRSLGKRPRPVTTDQAERTECHMDQAMTNSYGDVALEERCGVRNMQTDTQVAPGGTSDATNGPPQFRINGGPGNFFSRPLVY